MVQVGSKTGNLSMGPRAWRSLVGASTENVAAGLNHCIDVLSRTFSAHIIILYMYV